ncbi:hypothetical protein GlitD10_2845 [Gloeomargarita lithophora Alchichica-D10]|uniref:Co-chaperone DjlA N-terminal domain-containing protein n=1 Tax=Gloeomargarita lithophora Alchichica-D10 TaxID=1188229 RepID=A0A1J0AGY4_9CYAN|nr:TerB family tellurite resistance protein [Gloeomargarita lithophora]APB35189.1 hypothetical protein GlitD10_2845 [Gloeomargarita lithophora Alchichica-D10]
MSAMPSISPRQMNLLRVVAAMSWSDGELSPEESALILDRFSQLFAQDEQQQAQLRQELHDYVMQNIPLEEIVPKLQSDTEKFLVLQLGYAVIQASSRAPGEPLVNEDEQAAYSKLINLLQIPPEQVSALEATMDDQLQSHSVVDAVVDRVNQYLQHHS